MYIRMYVCRHGNAGKLSIHRGYRVRTDESICGGVCACIHVDGLPLTPLLLFLLESEVEGPDGEVDSLWVGLADVEEKVQDTFASHKACQQLRHPASTGGGEGRAEGVYTVQLNRLRRTGGKK